MSANRKRWNKVNTGPNTGSFVNEANESPENKIIREAKYKNLLKGVEERRAFVPSFNKKINDTGPNHPKEALLILGHSREGWKPRVPIEEGDDEETKERKSKDIIPDFIKVPKGSIAIIKAHPGDITLNYDTIKLYVNVLKKDNEEIILDPIRNIDKITELFGSISIFREGDMCPNIFHYPVAVWGQNNPDYQKITLKQGGIASIPLKVPIQDSEIYDLMRFDRRTFIDKYSISKNNKGNNIKKDLLLTEDDKIKILENFKFMDPTFPSATPGKSIKNDLEELINYYIGKETITNLFKDKMKSLTLHQSTIFERKPNCIIYALNCRSLPIYPKFVQEELRLGFNSPNNLNGIVSYYVPENMKEQPRRAINVTSVLRQKRNSTGNKTLKNNLNMVKARGRVSSMAPQIEQEIKEAINQRRLTTLSRARAPRQNTRSINLGEYDNLFQRRVLYPTYKDPLVKSLETIHPGIEGNRTRKSPRLLKRKYPYSPNNNPDNNTL